MTNASTPICWPTSLSQEVGQVWVRRPVKQNCATVNRLIRSLTNFGDFLSRSGMNWAVRAMWVGGCALFSTKLASRKCAVAGFTHARIDQGAAAEPEHGGRSAEIARGAAGAADGLHIQAAGTE